MLGDTWSLLVVRDLMFKGRKTFNELLNEEGIASNILADRLQRLEAAGVLVNDRDPDDGRRSVYRLSEKGIALAPVLVELVIWSSEYERTDAPPATVREMKSDREAFVARVRDGWKLSAKKGRRGS
jgi:DNA-binding HxlR family transcriptional regulator